MSETLHVNMQENTSSDTEIKDRAESSRLELLVVRTCLIDSFSVIMKKKIEK